MKICAGTGLARRWSVMHLNWQARREPMGYRSHLIHSVRRPISYIDQWALSCARQTRISTNLDKLDHYVVNKKAGHRGLPELFKFISSYLFLSLPFPLSFLSLPLSFPFPLLFLSLFWSWPWLFPGLEDIIRLSPFFLSPSRMAFRNSPQFFGTVPSARMKVL